MTVHPHSVPSHRPTPPRVYGNERRFKATLRGFVERGQALLDQAEGVQKRMALARADGDRLGAFALEYDWAQEVERWRNNAIKSVKRHLGERAEETMPNVTAAWTPRDGKPRHARTIEWVEPWLREALADLAVLTDALGASRDVAAVAARPGRFEELTESGLVDSRVTKDHAKEMADPRTPRQLYGAIGAAKELTEATLRAALDRLGVAWDKNDDFPRLMKLWRREVESLASPDPAAGSVLDRAQAALGNVVAFLAEWRNAYGSGHGRPKYHPGLRRRHARLATDAAETAIRFIVTTMDDLEKLPPRKG